MSHANQSPPDDDTEERDYSAFRMHTEPDPQEYIRFRRLASPKTPSKLWLSHLQWSAEKMDIQYHGHGDY